MEALKFCFWQLVSASPMGGSRYENSKFWKWLFFKLSQNFKCHLFQFSPLDFWNTSEIAYPDIIDDCPIARFLPHLSWKIEPRRTLWAALKRVDKCDFMKHKKFRSTFTSFSAVRYLLFVKAHSIKFSNFFSISFRWDPSLFSILFLPCYTVPRRVKAHERDKKMTFFYKMDIQRFQKVFFFFRDYV